MKRLVAFIAMNLILFGMALITSAETYEVKKGDNLWNIAREYDTTVANLMEINDLDSTIIHPKQMIKLNETYKVEKGDTLIHIGNELDVSVKQIKEWNNLTSDLIVPGQELEIYHIDSTRKDEVNRKGENRKESAIKTTTSLLKTLGGKSSGVEEGKTLSVTATAYTAECAGCSGITYTGIDLNKNRNAKVIAVDPKVIPLGSEVYVENYGYATAADIGGAIKGNKIDIHVPTKEEAYSWGVRNVKVTILAES